MDATAVNVNVTETSWPEAYLRDKLRSAALTRIEESRTTSKGLAATLGVPTFVAESLLSSESRWTLEVTIRVADALNLQWDVRIGGEPN
jgi:hypothetical protein